MMNDVNEDKAEAEAKAKAKDRLIGLAEASEIYGFNAGYLSELARRGRLEAQKIGNSWVTTPANVEEYIRSREPRGVYRDDIQA